MLRWITFVALVACGTEEQPARALGMNDVSVLLPLPADPAVPVLSTVEGLVPENLVASLVFANNIAPKSGANVVFRDFHVVAVRFDLEHVRLVLQPLAVVAGEVRTHDITLHAFYPIDDAAIVELHAVAQLQPSGGALAVNAGSAEYREKLRALVTTYARADALVKLTVIGQDKESAAFAWRFGGFERDEGGAFVAIPIPGLGGETHQHVLVAGGDTVYAVEPDNDTPTGFSLALNGFDFAAAAPPVQRAALEALAAIQNPTLHDADDLPCATCHVATFLTTTRARTAGIDPAELANRYVTAHDVTVDSIANRDARVVRAFGWAGAQPVISQRVANDTARVLELLKEP